MFLKPVEPEIEAPPARCVVCGEKCIDMSVNLAFLCDSHFDAWLACPRDPLVGGQVAMTAFVADARAQLRRSA